MRDASSPEQFSKENELLRRAVFRILNWLGRHELPVLLAFAGIAAGIWIFALIANEVSSGNSQGFDRAVLLMMRHADLSPKGPPLFQEAARDLTAIGGVAALTLLTLITAGFLLLSRRGHMAMFVCASVVGGLLTSSFLKSFFHRPRPDIIPLGSEVLTTSFPSGHSMLSAITYLTLGALLARSQERKRLKAYFMLVAGLLTVLVGWSRVYLGVHWPTDVMAGWTAGASWAILCWLVARWLQRRRTIEAEVLNSGEDEADQS
jgi:undecaprenyl-diphosphatase